MSSALSKDTLQLDTLTDILVRTVDRIDFIPLSRIQTTTFCQAILNTSHQALQACGGICTQIRKVRLTCLFAVFALGAIDGQVVSPATAGVHVHQLDEEALSDKWLTIVLTTCVKQVRNNTDFKLAAAHFNLLVCCAFGQFRSRSG